MPVWHGSADPRNLSTRFFERAANRFQCEVASVLAVWEVESAGRHFLEDGSVVRRFEPHHFPRQYWDDISYGERYLTASQRAAAVRRGWVGSLRPWQLSVLQSSETMFQSAAIVSVSEACRATSWGAPQIMGFNHQYAGHPTPVAMVEAMAKNAQEQLYAFLNVVDSWGLGTAIRARDWTRFARRYNGSGQVAEYARRMEAAYRRHSGGTASPVVLRVGTRGAAVARLQRALGVPDDGVFGPVTLQAVREFQSSEGLRVDGVVGAQTWAALEPRTAAEEPVKQAASALESIFRCWA